MGSRKNSSDSSHDTERMELPKDEATTEGGEEELEEEEEEVEEELDYGPKNPFHGPSMSQMFKIVDCISRGSPSSVFIARATQDRKLYVVKKIECHDESEARKAFHEYLELKKINHPSVSKYKEFFITFERQGSMIFVNVIMEYFPHGNLRTFIKSYQDRKVAIPEQVAKKILGEILDGLVYLHDKGYLHRNIKPSNIFLRNEKAMMLGDLGVATIMKDVRTNTRQIFRGVVFMAPEIGQQSHDQKTDLYSVGGVLLNILSTSVYFETEFYKKLGEIKESPEVLNEVLDLIASKITYSKSMITTVQMLLQHKHGNRPSTLELIKSGFIQECMAQVDSTTTETISKEERGVASLISLSSEGREDIWKVLAYIAETLDYEACLADGLSALADILRDDEHAHELVDQKARNMIATAMWNNLFIKDVQIPGCYVLSNLIVFSKPDDYLFSQDVYTIVHKIMAGHEYNPEVQLAAADLILVLSADEKVSQAIVQLGAIHDMLTAMRHARYHASLNAVCCLALWSLAADTENLKVTVKENAIRDVCLALKIHKVSPDVCEAAAAALVSLLLDDGCYDIFNELNCAGNLVTAINLHTRNASVVKNCCKVLATVIEANEDCAYSFLSSDEDEGSPAGIPTVMKAYLMHKDNADVVENIVRLMLDLSNYEDIVAEMQLANVGPQLLSEVHKRYKENITIKGPVETALERIGEVKAIASKKLSDAKAMQVALSYRPFRFGGEVKSSCQSILSRWQVSHENVPAELTHKSSAVTDKGKKKVEVKDHIQLKKTSKTKHRERDSK